MAAAGKKKKAAPKKAAAAKKPVKKAAPKPAKPAKKATPAKKAAPAAKKAAPAKKAVPKKAAAPKKPIAAKKPAAPKKLAAPKKAAAEAKKPVKKAAPAAKKATAVKKAAKSGMAQISLRIRLRGYDYRQIDQAAEMITTTVRHSGASVRGPIPLPTTITRFDLLRSPHVDKDSREQIEIRTYHRLLEVSNPTEKTAKALEDLQTPDGVSLNLVQRQ